MFFRLRFVPNGNEIVPNKHFDEKKCCERGYPIYKCVYICGGLDEMFALAEPNVRVGC